MPSIMRKLSEVYSADSYHESPKMRQASYTVSTEAPIAERRRPDFRHKVYGSHGKIESSVDSAPFSSDDQMFRSHNGTKNSLRKVQSSNDMIGSKLTHESRPSTRTTSAQHVLTDQIRRSISMADKSEADTPQMQMPSSHLTCQLPNGPHSKVSSSKDNSTSRMTKSRSCNNLGNLHIDVSAAALMTGSADTSSTPVAPGPITTRGRVRQSNSFTSLTDLDAGRNCPPSPARARPVSYDEREKRMAAASKTQQRAPLTQCTRTTSGHDFGALKCKVSSSRDTGTSRMTKSRSCNNLGNFHIDVAPAALMTGSAETPSTPVTPGPTTTRGRVRQSNSLTSLTDLDAGRSRLPSPARARPVSFDGRETRMNKAFAASCERELERLRRSCRSKQEVAPSTGDSPPLRQPMPESSYAPLSLIGMFILALCSIVCRLLDFARPKTHSADKTCGNLTLTESDAKSERTLARAELALAKQKLARAQECVALAEARLAAAR